MPDGRTTKVYAARLKPTDGDRLLEHGRNAGDAVRALLAIADEHASCPPPAGTRARKAPAKTPPRRPAAAAVPRPAAAVPVRFRVARKGREPYETTDWAKAVRVADREGVFVEELTT